MPFQDATRAALAKPIDWRIGMPAAAEEADVILLFGGDGTIHRHLGQLVKLGLPVLIVPAGSGNDFARALGLRRVRDSLAAWRRFCRQRDNVRQIDLGVIIPLNAEDRAADRELGTQRYFCCAAGVGLDGEISRRANRLPRWLRRHGGYALSLPSSLFGFAPFLMKIQTLSGAAKDGVAEGAAHRGEVGSGEAPKEQQSVWLPRSNEPTMLAVFANTPVYGGGMKVAPRAQMDDGLLDVCLVTDIDKFKLFCLFPTVYFGRHLSRPEVKYFQSARLRVETEHPLDVYADGEYVCRTPVEVTIQSAALRVPTLQ
jgi:diacylglycerol kinase (ATP)